MGDRLSSAGLGSDAGGADDAAHDGPTVRDAEGVDARTSDDAGKDGGKSDSGADAPSGDAKSEASASGLDPDVVLPDPSGAPCSQPGSTVDCPGVQACRMASPTGGRCDDCYPQGRCSGLVTTACTQSLDCDVNLQCFRGKCTLFCSLPQGTECGPPGICIDVGHPTIGLCDPWQL